MKLFFITIIYFFLIENSYAYLDPGTGSILLQAILAVIAAVGTFFAFFKEKFKKFIGKIFKKKTKTKDTL